MKNCIKLEGNLNGLIPNAAYSALTRTLPLLFARLNMIAISMHLAHNHHCYEIKIPQGVDRLNKGLRTMLDTPGNQVPFSITGKPCTALQTLDHLRKTFERSSLGSTFIVYQGHKTMYALRALSKIQRRDIDRRFQYVQWLLHQLGVRSRRATLILPIDKTAQQINQQSPSWHSDCSGLKQPKHNRDCLVNSIQRRPQPGTIPQRVRFGRQRFIGHYH